MKKIMILAATVLMFFLFGCAKAKTILVEKNESVPDGIAYMKAVSYEDGILTLTITNNSDESIIFGEDYYLEKSQNGDYMQVEPKEEFYWIDIATILEPGKSQDITCNLSYYGNLEAGDYRLVKTGLTADFTLR